MNTKHFVTCVMPTYGRPRFVEQAVKLFLAQAWTRSELLIFDDSPAELRVRVRENSRIKVFQLGERVSMGEKHNLGLDAAQGEFIAHFDDDDWQSPRRLTRQVETLVLEDLDICGFLTDCLLTTGDARFWRFDRAYGKRTGLVGNSVIDFGVPFMDGSAAFRRSAIGEARYPTMPTGQKVVFLHQMWKAGAKIKSLPNNGMYVYVRHAPKSSAVNTWQYLKDRRLLEIEKPTWFPFADLDFYRRAV